MKKILYIFLGVLLVSCYQMEKPEKPEKLIAKDKMVNILVDMTLFNSAKGINKRKLENKGINLEQFVFEKHAIDSVQFASSNRYYSYNIEDYQSIYNRVRDSLSKLKTKYSTIDNNNKRKKKRADSIKRAKKRDSAFKARKGVKLLKEDFKAGKMTSKRKVNKKPE